MQSEPHARVGSQTREESSPLVVLTMNLRRYASVPRDWQVPLCTYVCTCVRMYVCVCVCLPREAVHREVSRVLADAPDVLCLQEGLEGMDIVSQIGYKRIASSVLRAQALRDAVYQSPLELNTCSSSSHGRLLVNELYIRSGSNWEAPSSRVKKIGKGGHGQAIDSGAAQISSDMMLEFEGDRSQGGGTWPLATRCVARHPAALSVAFGCFWARCGQSFATGTNQRGHSHTSSIRSFLEGVLRIRILLRWRRKGPCKWSVSSNSLTATWGSQMEISASWWVPLERRRKWGPFWPGALAQSALLCSGSRCIQFRLPKRGVTATLSGYLKAHMIFQS